MTATSKLFTAVGVLLLLGFGLCGLDALRPSVSHGESLGSNTAFAGFALCLLAIVVLVVGVISIVLSNLFASRKNKP